MEQEIARRIAASRTHLTKAVFPNTTNHYDTLFGGKALQLMDEAAFICATRFSRKRMVTINSSSIDFLEPIPAGSIIELIAEVVQVGRTSLKIQVNIYLEEMYDEIRFKAIDGIFTFVAIDENRLPIPVLG